MSLRLIEEYPDHDVDRRSAGPVFTIGEKIVHSTQICKKCYGEALEFWETDLPEVSWKNLQPYKKVYGSDIVIQNFGSPDIIHTYSKTSKYEVIDYKNKK